MEPMFNAGGGREPRGSKADQASGKGSIEEITDRRCSFITFGLADLRR